MSDETSDPVKPDAQECAHPSFLLNPTVGPNRPEAIVCRNCGVPLDQSGVSQEERDGLCLSAMVTLGALQISYLVSIDRNLNQMLKKMGVRIDDTSIDGGTV